MKIYTSYFYQVRNMNNKIIPLSTAMWDPKWFHNFKEQSYRFIDKNRVINGLRISPFVPNNKLKGLCYGYDNCIYKNPNLCSFLKRYEEQLFSLNFQNIYKRFERLAEKYKENFNIQEEVSFALLVHEAPNNKCSEREAIQKWLKKYDLFAGEFGQKK